LLLELAFSSELLQKPISFLPPGILLAIELVLVSHYTMPSGMESPVLSLFVVFKIPRLPRWNGSLAEITWLLKTLLEVLGKDLSFLQK
jgi:hypothetical protein